MNDTAIEAALRATLKAAAPLEVPARLEDRARDIPAIAHPANRWSSRFTTRTWSVAIAAAVGLILAIALFVPRIASGPGGGPPNPFRADSKFGSLGASDLELTVDGRVFRVPASVPQAGFNTPALPGAGTYGRLLVQWHDGATPMTLVMHFAANAHTWWVSEIVASDGRTGPSGWIYFEGPFFERPIGASFSGTAELSSVRSTYGATGTLSFGKFDLSAFADGSTHNPVAGQMPSGGGSEPDFVPLVGTTGSAVLGYVPTAELQDPVPIQSIGGQSPDLPVYGPDFKTLVGYSVSGTGFEPVKATGTTTPALLPSVEPSPSPAPNAAAGLTWQAISITGSSNLEIETVAGLPDGYIGAAQVNGDPTKVSLWRSTDGISWHEQPASPAFTEAKTYWYDSIASVIETSPGHLLAVGSANNGDASVFNAVAWTSNDSGLTWQRATVGGAADAEMSDVAATSNGLVAVGVDGHPSGGTQLIGIRGAAVWTSLDGTHWTRTPTQPSFAGTQMDHVIAVGPVAIATGLDVPTGSGSVAPPIWRSTDGLTWTRAAAVSATPLSLGADAAIWTGTSFVVSGTQILGDGRYIWTSTDGLSWSIADVQGARAPSLAGLAISGSTIVLTGTPSSGGQVLLWESTGGLSWQSIQAPGVMDGGVPMRIVSGPKGLLILNSNTHGTTGWLGTH
jgi:hypothetical protein